MTRLTASGIRGLASMVASRAGPVVPTKPIEVTQQFVPWRDGKDITGTDQWGFKWYLVNVNFIGINTGGKYQIENGCDAYLVLGDQPISTEKLSTRSAKVVPPFTSGIYDIGRDSFSVTCLCAGYDFTTARATPGANSPFMDVKGALSAVTIVSLSGDEKPTTEPGLRTGWQRIYDWYDLTTPPNSAITVAHNALWNSPSCDFTGSKSVVATAQLNCAATASCTVSIITLSRKSSSIQYNIGSQTQTVAGNLNFVVATTDLVGTGPLIQVVNNDNVNSITVQDANLEVAF